MILAALTTAVAAQEAPGVFVAVGYGGFRGWSVDGQAWTAERWEAESRDDDLVIFSLTYRAGVFLCAGGGGGKGFILRSVDGKQWTEVATDRHRIHDVIALEDGFLSVFADHFQASADGSAWRPMAEAKPKAPDGVGGGFFRRYAVGEGVIVFAGDYGLPGGVPRVGWIGSTRGGATAMTVAMQPSDVRGLAFGNGRFIACTHAGAVLVSKDGQEFAASGPATGDEHDDDCVRFAGGIFYLIGRKGWQSSPDGAQWAPVAHPPHLPRAAAPGGATIDGGWGGLQVAPDGKTWQKATVPVDPKGITAVAYGVPLAALPQRAAH
jgi:hypothetical protein